MKFITAITLVAASLPTIMAKCCPKQGVFGCSVSGGSCNIFCCNCSVRRQISRSLVPSVQPIRHSPITNAVFLQGTCGSKRGLADSATAESRDITVDVFAEKSTMTLDGESMPSSHTVFLSELQYF